MTIKNYVPSGLKLKNGKKVTFYELKNTTILETKYVVRYYWPIIHRLGIEDLFPTQMVRIQSATQFWSSSTRQGPTA